MPIFEYTCDDCGKRFEKLVRRTTGPDADQILCPSCGASRLTQRASSFAAQSSGMSKSDTGLPRDASPLPDSSEEHHH